MRSQFENGLGSDSPDCLKILRTAEGEIRAISSFFGVSKGDDSLGKHFADSRQACQFAPTGRVWIDLGFDLPIAAGPSIRLALLAGDSKIGRSGSQAGY